VVPARSTIPALAAFAAENWGERPAVIDADLTVSYRRLVGASREAALGLLALGVEKGDRVALWLPNRWEWIAAAIAIQSTGAVLVPLNTRLKGREVADVLNRAGVRHLVSAGQFLGVFYPDMLADQALPSLERIVVMDAAIGDDPRQLGWTDLLAAGASGREDELDARIDGLEPTDLSDLMFTSGTTGRAKGAMFTHAQTMNAARVTIDINGLVADDRYATFGPFSHNAAYKAGWVPAMAVGCCMVITADTTSSGVMALIAGKRVTVMPAPPTVWQSILDDPALTATDMSCLRRISTGGTTVPIELVRRLTSTFGEAIVATGYGLTECCGSAANTRDGDSADVVALTAGRAVPGTELRIVAPETGDHAQPGDAGEILVRNASVTLGYLGDPEATAAAIDPDGWLHTGDIGWLDEGGNLHVTDRLKDMYIVGGFNCYPAEVEHLLEGLPGVAQSAVVGIPDERLGQVGFAFIVRGPDLSLSEAEVIAWCRQNMANYKAPRVVRFVDTLPINASGKVMKPVLRELAMA
jgi:HIP---CoA ligase